MLSFSRRPERLIHGKTDLTRRLQILRNNSNCGSNCGRNAEWRKKEKASDCTVHPEKPKPAEFVLIVNGRGSASVSFTSAWELGYQIIKCTKVKFLYAFAHRNSGGHDNNRNTYGTANKIWSDFGLRVREKWLIQKLLQGTLIFCSVRRPLWTKAVRTTNHNVKNNWQLINLPS